MPTIAEKRATFRQLHESGYFIMPNAWDIGSAVRLTKLGFKAIASTSAGAAWAIGKDDGEISLDEALAHLRLLVDATDLPVNADFENGFADAPVAVAKNAALAADTGVAGLSIEDWSGSACYDLPLAVERIIACREAMDPAALLVGRHERFRVPAESDAASVARAVAYGEAGADCLFVPGLADHGAVAELVAAVAPKPVSMIAMKFDEQIVQFANLGVRRFSTGGGLPAIAWAAFDAAARSLRDYEP